MRLEDVIQLHKCKMKQEYEAEHDGVIYVDNNLLANAIRTWLEDEVLPKERKDKNEFNNPYQYNEGFNDCLSTIKERIKGKK